MIQPTLYPHYFRDGLPMAHYRIASCDGSQTCDLMKKSWSQEAKELVDKMVANLTKPKI